MGLSGGDALSRWTSNATVPSFLTPGNRRWYTFRRAVGRELNFYRIHVLVFVFTPLIAAAIFYASNGEQHIPFIDCLFVCVSAMTVTGLVTYNISTSTPWQQAILFILMLLGNISAVSVTMIWVRRHFFRVKFDHVIKNNAAARKKAHDIEEAHHLQRRKGVLRLKHKLGIHKLERLGHRKRDAEGDEVGMHSMSTSSTDRLAEAELKAAKEAKRKEEAKKRKHKGPLRTDMIVRIDQPAMLVNPMGMPSQGHPAPLDVDAGGSGGGILNNATQQLPTNGSAHQAEEAVSSDGIEAQQYPSIRISLPPNHSGDSTSLRQPMDSQTFASSAGYDTMPLTDSPAQLHSRGPLDAEANADNAVEDGDVVSSIHAASDDVDGLGAATSSPRTRFAGVDSPSGRRRRLSDPSIGQRAGQHARRGSESGLNVKYGHFNNPGGRVSVDWRPGEDRMPRAQTVEFAEPPRTGAGERPSRATQGPDRGYTTGYLPRTTTGSSGFPRQRTFERNPTIYSTYRGVPLTRTATSAKDRGFGGFPTPIELAGKGLRAVLPGVRDRIVRSTTMQRSTTIASTHSLTRAGTEQTMGTTAGGKSAPYLSFDVNVYGNSMFHSLTEAQRDELGGVEYRALDLLAKIVPLYWFGVQMSMVVLVAPYLASSAYDKYRPVFQSQGSYEPDTTWFWFFSVTSAYSNTGMSLIDTSMIQMADAYLPLTAMGFLILVGNTAFPVFLRFWIWVYSKLVPKASRSYETLRFILDHPRRCFVYLFPSGQTWFLLAIITTFTFIDWFFFLILDIGNPEIEHIPLPQRVFDGLFQSVAVRAAGFQVVSLLSLAPAVQFLYVIMMYISAYPIALSVRSTNVYEERSLGVYVEKNGGDEDAELPNSSSPAGWGTYLAAHARRQLAFDIWWLGFALWLVCIIERRDIQDPASNGWFTVFSCMFELTSAYGTVGLSTGTPTDNFSLSGRFHTLSKLVVIATMLRGRHRGLPVAIDRSILLPQDLEDQDAADEAWSMMDATSRGGDGAQSLNRTSTASALRWTESQSARGEDDEADKGHGVDLTDSPDAQRQSSSALGPADGLRHHAGHAAPMFSYGHPLSSTMSPSNLDAIEERREGPGADGSPMEEYMYRTLSREGKERSPEQKGALAGHSATSSDDLETGGSASDKAHSSTSGGSSKSGRSGSSDAMHGKNDMRRTPSAVSARRLSAGQSGVPTLNVSSTHATEAHPAPSTTAGDSDEADHPRPDARHSGHKDALHDNKPLGQQPSLSGKEDVAGSRRGGGDASDDARKEDDDEKAHPVVAAMYGSSAPRLIDSNGSSENAE
ncbi:unnamed protein product [Parajaminaea phylloscopi]